MSPPRDSEVKTPRTQSAAIPTQARRAPVGEAAVERECAGQSQGHHEPRGELVRVAHRARRTHRVADGEARVRRWSQEPDQCRLPSGADDRRKHPDDVSVRAHRGVDDRQQ